MRFSASALSLIAAAAGVGSLLVSAAQANETRPWPVDEFVRVCFNNNPFLDRIEKMAADENWKIESAEERAKLFERQPNGEQSWLVSAYDSTYRIKIFSIPIPESLASDPGFADYKTITSCMAMFGSGPGTQERIAATAKLFKTPPTASAVLYGNVKRTEWTLEENNHKMVVMYSEFVGKKQRGDFIESVVLSK